VSRMLLDAARSNSLLSGITLPRKRYRCVSPSAYLSGTVSSDDQKKRKEKKKKKKKKDENEKTKQRKKKVIYVSGSRFRRFSLPFAFTYNLHVRAFA